MRKIWKYILPVAFVEWYATKNCERFDMIDGNTKMVVVHPFYNILIIVESNITGQ